MSVPNLSEQCEHDPTNDKSVPNLSSTGTNDESPAVSLLETFAAVARRRASGATCSAASTNANNTRNTANSLNSGIFGRGLTTNSVSSLVRLALSSNFPSGLLNQVFGNDTFVSVLIALGNMILFPGPVFPQFEPWSKLPVSVKTDQ